jgi:hypothetical protein
MCTQVGVELMKSKEVKTFQSKMREKVCIRTTYSGELRNYVNESDALAIAREADQLVKQPCKWVWDDGDFATKCGHHFQFIHEGVKENEFEYCPYCGGAITE